MNDVSGQMIDGNTLEIEVNGVAGQVALPLGDGWEELDLSNIPSDFSVGDMLAISFKLTMSTSCASWTQKPLSTNIITTSNITENSSNIVHAMYYVNSSGCFTKHLIFIREDENYIEATYLDYIDSASSLNSGTGNIFLLSALAFNGAGCTTGSRSISRDNITNYVARMWRKKA